MKPVFGICLASLAALTTVAIAQNRPAQNIPTANPGRTGATAGQQQQEDRADEQKFIRHAASDNNFEIQLGQLVEQKAQDQQVKSLAQRLVQDHQKAQQQLEQIAKQEGVNISTNELMPVHQACLQEFQKMQGPELERAFTFDQVGDHHKDLLKYMWQEEHAQSPQLKQYAQQTVPVLREHLRMAEQAADQFVPEARTAGSHMRGERTEGTEGTTGAGSTGSGTTGSTGTTGGAGTSGTTGGRTGR